MKRKLMVEGMSCQHCVQALTQALSEIGAADVQVDLPTGTVYIESPEDVTEAQLTEAVDEAGFTLASLD